CSNAAGPSSDPELPTLPNQPRNNPTLTRANLQPESRRTGTMAGLHPHVPRIYRFAATGLGASMWFFLMYRAKKDGPVLLGWKHPWDH
ncbi:hypothetical protein B0T22DRAFT_238439, partial [Podospora appendiculata]